MPLLEKNNQWGERLRWHSLFLLPATTESAATFEQIRGFIASTTPIAMELREPGDTLVIDNWRVLHGRSPVSTKNSPRQIERSYLGALH